jgi:lactam utilization protein B
VERPQQLTRQTELTHTLLLPVVDKQSVACGDHAVEERELARPLPLAPEGAQLISGRIEYPDVRTTLTRNGDVAVAEPYRRANPEQFV